jgi:hypothetical protein
MQTFLSAGHELDAATTEQTTRFRKKPIVIEARQFRNDGSSYALILWINEGQHAIGRELAQWHNNNIMVPTLEGQHVASPGDWIIRGVAGEHYPCKPDIFAATYEPA